MGFSGLRGNRTSWIVGGVAVLLIFVLLAAISGRNRPEGTGTELAPGESRTLRARVVEVVEEGVVDQGEFQQPTQRLRLRFGRGLFEGQEVEVEHGQMVLTGKSRLYRAGDLVLVDYVRTVEGRDLFVVADYVRTGPMLWLTLLFVGAILLLNGRQGLRSLIGMAVSLAVIAAFVVPQILAGHNALGVALAGSAVMMGLSLYLVYGWTPKTHVAVCGLVAGLLITGLLAMWAVGWTRLSGYAAEEIGFLQVAGIQLDSRGLLLAGVIIGSLGALDDVAIGQSSAIFELSKANPRLGRGALFRHGMVIGRDHIAAMVNTLLLAYVGAALPLVLLFSVYSDPLAITLNREIIAEEIVRTLVGSLGLLAGVPLTSAIAAWFARSSGHGEGTP